jgi:hypothetical protein
MSIDLDRSRTSGLARTPRPAMVALALAGHALLAIALARSDGHQNPLALGLVLLAGAVIVVSITRPAASNRGWTGVEPLAWGLALASTLSLFDLPPGRSLQPDVSFTPFVALVALAAALVASYALDLWAPERAAPAPLAAARRAALLAIAATLGAWLLFASPAPTIDVWDVHQQGAAALLHGHSAYAEGVIDTEDTHSFAREIGVYAYPPLNLLLTTVAYALTGETRWAQLAAILSGAALLWLVARRASGSANFADLVALLLLFHPRGLFVLEQAWGEPLALPFLAGFALAASSGRPRLAAVLAGLLVALKQHFVLYLPALALVPGIGVSGALIAVGVAAATYVPFMIATPRGLIDAVVMHHLKNPFRADSLSLPATLACLGNGEARLPSWIGPLGALGTFALLPRVARRMAPLLLAASLTFLVFFVLGRQAFANYYYLLDATLILAAAAAADDVRAPDGPALATPGAG